MQDGQDNNGLARIRERVSRLEGQFEMIEETVKKTDEKVDCVDRKLTDVASTQRSMLGDLSAIKKLGLGLVGGAGLFLLVEVVKLVKSGV